MAILRDGLYVLVMLAVTSNQTSTLHLDPDHVNTFTDIHSLSAVLGQKFKVLADSRGEAIGLEATDGHPPMSTAKFVSVGLGLVGASMPNPPISSVRWVGPQNMPHRIDGSRLRDDASICCSTQEVFYFNKTLVDYFGKTQVIAQKNQVGVYQLIRHGLCSHRGACTGECHQIYVNVPLVVHPTRAGQRISFRLFKIPGYCTCRVRSTLF